MQSNTTQDLLVISVFAKSGACFAAYDLFQAISSVGLQYGEMNIFHYYNFSPSGKNILFSLASATEPGEFDLDQIGDFTCAGLTLFMNMHAVPDPKEAFELMLITAEQLAEDLEGELRAGQRTPWNLNMFEEYLQKIIQYQRKRFK